MKIAIGAVGHLKKGPEADLAADYCQRLNGLGRQLGFRGIDVFEVEASKSLPRQQRQAKEAELLLAPIDPQDHVFVLDERGRAYSSMQFSKTVGDLKDNGVGTLWFLIGGADGHAPHVQDLLKAHKAKALSFGIATWPHMMVRAMLCEQLYRAISILGNHPYHRE